MSSSFILSYGPITTSGTVTSYLPLTSAWSAPLECSSLFLESGDRLFLNAPEYQNDVVGAPACLPPQISSWWFQTDNTASPTTTLLGGYYFLCPEAYTTIFQVAYDATTTIGCCPFSYSYGGTLVAPGRALQCTSTLPAGTITYVVPPTSGTVYTTTSNFISTPTAIVGVQINGYIFSGAPENSATTSNSATLAGAGSTSSSSIVTTSAATNNSSSLSQGAKVIVAVGVSLGLIGLASLLAALLLFRRNRRKRNQDRTAPPENLPHQKPELDSNTVLIHEMDTETPAHEIASFLNNRPPAAEMG